MFESLIPGRGEDRLRAALMGQQNSGKSTLFNALTGLNQHIANYAGVTIEKKSGLYRDDGLTVEVVDLPGTYNLTSYSLEERVARDYLLREHPDIVVNVLDASNLARGLHLTLQLREAGFPLIAVLNMSDVAKRLGLDIDQAELGRRLGVPTIAAVGRKGSGLAALRAAIRSSGLRSSETKETAPALVLDYGELEPALASLVGDIAADPELARIATPRWLALKLLEGDEGVAALVRSVDPQAPCLAAAEALRADRAAAGEELAADVAAAARAAAIGDILAACVADRRAGEVPLSERIDRLLLNRWLAPLFLVATAWAIYELAIVQGYELTKVTWPLLAAFRNHAAALLPDAGFLYDPEVRSLGLWLVDSANTLLNYVPIFLILFALIAILEDSGYMARIAFIFDRVLHRFGLHGQSTLPFILAGVFAGGCAVPGVMATKGIPDERARMATILTVPFMNCLAKVPLYTLLINIYFAEDKGLVLFFLSTITVIVALLIAKLLTTTVLRKSETAPFVMDLPHYHAPTLLGVARRAFDRTWVYIKKVGTVVVAVAAVVYMLLQFPGLTAEERAAYETRGEAALHAFFRGMEGNPLAAAVPDQAAAIRLLNAATDYRALKMNAGGAESSKAVDEAFAKAHPAFVPFVLRSPDKAGRDAARLLKQLDGERRTLRQEMRQTKIFNSFLGRIGRSMEPVTQFAGFDWKINVALLSSFAARESSVATLGVLFAQPEGENQTLESRMGDEQKAMGYTAMAALAVMLFFALYPPCLATTIMVRVQTNSYGWMLFSILFPTALGLTVSTFVFTLGNLLHMSGVEMMIWIYAGALALLLAVGLWKRAPRGARTEETT